MYERAEFGSLCFFLIHWNERKLKTKTVEAATYAVPVRPDLDFWKAFEFGEEKNLSRSQAEEYGVRVEWVTEGMERSPRPDLRMLLSVSLANVIGRRKRD